MTDLDDVRRAVEGVLPAVDAHADATYRDRRLPDAVVDALAGTGINRLLLRTLDPAADGHRLSGRWPFTSNCLHSDWLGLGAVQAGADDPRPRVAFVPRADVTIEDTWDSTGLRGTGSHDVVVEGAVVDDAHWCILNGPTWPDGRLWRMPIAWRRRDRPAVGHARPAVQEITEPDRDGRRRVAEAETSHCETARGATAGRRRRRSSPRPDPERSRPVPAPQGERRRPPVARYGIVCAPSAGLEPAHTAPEADALSAELRGLRTDHPTVSGTRSREGDRPVCARWPR